MPKSREESARDTFSTSEVAIGAGLTVRNVLFLCSEGVVPVVGGGRGQGHHRRFGFEGLARLATIAAFYHAGIEIFLASRLVREIGEETTFDNLSNLESFLARPHSTVVGAMQDEGLDPDNAYFLHDALRRLSASYRPSAAMPYDRLIEIFDRRYVFLNSLDPDEGTQTLTPSGHPGALYKVTGWRKGSSNIEIVHARPHRRGKPPAEWKVARVDFKGMTCTNVSLAIRDALDAVAAQRGG